MGTPPHVALELNMNVSVSAPLVVVQKLSWVRPPEVTVKPPTTGTLFQVVSGRQIEPVPRPCTAIVTRRRSPPPALKLSGGVTVIDDGMSGVSATVSAVQLAVLVVVAVALVAWLPAAGWRVASSPPLAQLLCGVCWVG